MKEEKELANILVIDDEADMRNNLADALEKEGYRVKTAKDGHEAIERIKAQTFNVVIMDIRIPGINGIEALKAIKKIGPEMIVVMITAYASMETAIESMRKGAYDYVVKPFDMNKLIAIIKRGLERQRLSEENRRLLYDLKEKSESLSKKVRELFVLTEISREMSSTLDPENLLNLIVGRATEVIGAKRGSLMLIDPDSGDLSVKVAKGWDRRIAQKNRVKVGQGVAGWVAKEGKPLLNVDLARDPRFKRQVGQRYESESFLCVPLIDKNGVIGVLNVNEKVSEGMFNEDDLELLSILANQAATTIENANLYKNLQVVYLGTVTTLAATIDAKSHYTREHSERVTRYAVTLARNLNLPAKEVETIGLAGKLHDIGKIGIPDHILGKPSRLSEQEWKEVKAHPGRGANMLMPLEFLREIVPLVRHHHERYDGNGYPDGLKGKKIELGARIIAVADTFEAMTSERPYRSAFNVEEAKALIKVNAGTQFDPQIAKTFIAEMK